MEGLRSRTWGAPKWTKMHQKGHLCKTDQKISNLSSMTNMHMRFTKTRNCYRKGPLNKIHGAFWCSSCTTPWTLHNLLWLLYPSRCPFHPEMDYISHSGWIQNSLLCHAMMTILVHFGASYVRPFDLLWLLSSFRCLFNPEIDHISHSGQIQNTKLCLTVETFLV